MAGRKAHEAGQRLAGRRRQVAARCEVCGEAITGLVTRRYCGNTCRLRASRQRRRDGALATGRVPALIVRLDATAARLGRGRTFPDSAPLVERLRTVAGAAPLVERLPTESGAGH